jgi:Zn-dependent protease with chaperone function
MCQGERDKIAFVLGHEMAHIVRRHALDRIVKDAALSLLLRHSSSQRAASAWLNQTGRQMLTCAYSRDNELEADAFAESLVRTAGGDALAGERLLEKLVQRTSAQRVAIAGDYFATHPPLMERVANLRAKRQG